VLAALGGLPFHLSCRSSLGDSSSPIPGRGVWPVYHCASACISGQVHLMVRIFVSGDAGVPWDPVDHGCDSMAKEAPHLWVDLPHQSLPWARLQACCLSDCGLRVAEQCHHLHSMLLQCFAVLDCYVKRKSDRPQFRVEHLHESSPLKAEVRPPFISMFTHCCGSHSDII